MKHYAHLVLLGVPLVASCALQPINSDASVGSPPEVVQPGPGNPLPDPNTGEAPIITQTPDIQIFTDPGVGPEGDTTTEACTQTSLQATMLLNRYCATCHSQGGASLGGFSDVLDLQKLEDPTNLAPIAKIPFIVPGDPPRSRLYQQVFLGNMPKNDPRIPQDRCAPGALSCPLSTSQVSVIEAWIADCLGVPRATSQTQ
jgi:mono/diheme cytochrome c family protein